MKKNRGTIYKQTKVDKHSSMGIVIEYIKENTRVLDVGCACGDLGEALKKQKECRLWGMDLNEESIDIAMQTGVYEEVFKVDLNRFKSDSFESFFGSFDYIIFGDVLEHILEPQEVLQSFKKLLKDDGHFLLSIPNIAHASIKANLLVDNFMYTPYGLLDETHIKFFTRKTIPIFLAGINLEVENTQYTFKDKIGFQEENPYNELEECVQKIIFCNPYSYVCQYVMKVKKSHLAIKKLIKINFDRVNTFENIIPQAALNLQRNDIDELKELPDKTQMKLDLVQSSKFWKLRCVYIIYKAKVQFVFLSPRKFFRKYLKI